MLEKPKAGGKKKKLSSVALQLQKEINALSSFSSVSSTGAPISTSVVTFKT